MLDSLNKFRNSFKYYTELRVQENRNIRIGLLNGNLISNDQSIESGVSSRVFKDGDWGFSSNASYNDADDHAYKASSLNSEKQQTRPRQDRPGRQDPH